MMLEKSSHLSWQRSPKKTRAWQLCFRDPRDQTTHLRAMEDQQIAQRLFPYSLQALDEGVVEVLGSRGISFQELLFENPAVLEEIRLFENLGAWLRSVHELDGPTGFGAYLQPDEYLTINALMSSLFSTLGAAMHRLDEEEELQGRTLESLAELRNELASFHPHGRSTWVLGRFSPQFLILNPLSLEVEGYLDLSQIRKSPPEWDLGALYSLDLFANNPAFERGFWKGYRAVLTRDLERRIDYFRRFHQLCSLLEGE